jgi:hypothetical protein
VVLVLVLAVLVAVEMVAQALHLARPVLQVLHLLVVAVVVAQFLAQQPQVVMVDQVF